MAQTILYYPNIDIQDSTWLRNAILYWDKISSIVPYDNYPDFSPEILYLQECGLYEPILPRDLFYSEFASDFSKTVIQRMKHNKKHFSVKNRNGTPATRVRRNKIYAPAIYEFIHFRKVPSDLLDYLLDKRIVRDYHRDGWLEIDSKAAAIYMRTLAEFIVKYHSEDIVIGTDQAYNQNDFYHSAAPRATSACISISLNNCLPQPSMDVGFEELLDFKQRRQQELLEFRRKLRDFEAAISTCESDDEIKFQTEKFKESWQAALVQSQKMYKGRKLSFVLGSLSTLIGVPSVMQSVKTGIQELSPAHPGSIASSILLGGAAAIDIGYKFVNYKNRVNAQRSSAGFSYLIKASKAGIINSF